MIPPFGAVWSVYVKRALDSRLTLFLKDLFVLIIHVLCACVQFKHRLKSKSDVRPTECTSLAAQAPNVLVPTASDAWR